MIKIRNGMFETNSSSTHTCILCSKNNYIRWCKKELVWVNSGYIKELINEHSKPEYIEDDFVNVKAFYDIPLAKVYEKDNYLMKRYNKKAEKYTIGDVWDIFEVFDHQSIDNWYYDNDDEDENNFVHQYRAAKETFDNIDEIQEVVNSFSNYIHPEDPIYYESWRHFFVFILGCYKMDTVLSPSYEKEEITERTIEGVDIVSYCTYGHD